MNLFGFRPLLSVSTCLTPYSRRRLQDKISAARWKGWCQPGPIFQNTVHVPRHNVILYRNNVILTPDQLFDIGCILCKKGCCGWFSNVIPVSHISFLAIPALCFCKKSFIKLILIQVINKILKKEHNNSFYIYYRACSGKWGMGILPLSEWTRNYRNYILCCLISICSNHVASWI